MLIIGFIIAGAFILMICLIVRGYLEDIIDLENRVLQLEKRINECEKVKEEYKNTLNILFENLEVLNIDTYKKLKEYDRKEGEFSMACKKGKGGRRK